MLVHCFLVLGLYISPVFSYAAGAPKEACDDLQTSHGTQGDGVHYSIKPSIYNVNRSDTLQVTIEGDLFKGFLVQALTDDKDRTTVGKFLIPVNHPYAQVLHCNAKADAATHKKIYGDGVHAVTVDWRAPEDYSGTVVFTGTVVKSYSQFWGGISSGPVIIN